MSDDDDDDSSSTLYSCLICNCDDDLSMFDEWLLAMINILYQWHATVSSSSIQLTAVSDIGRNLTITGRNLTIIYKFLSLTNLSLSKLWGSPVTLSLRP